MYNTECVHYDYGKTAPTAYGAFCDITKKGVTVCTGCPHAITQKEVDAFKPVLSIYRM